MRTSCLHTAAWVAGSLLYAFTGPAPAGEAVAQQVLIAAEASKFKDVVVTEVAQTLRQEGHIVNIIPLDKLADEPTGKYRAILLVNTCRAWSPSREVRNFLRKLGDDEKKKLVVLTTAGSAECELDASGVDAISSASKLTRRPVITQSILDKLRARLAIP